jgi:hypothetical protein
MTHSSTDSSLVERLRKGTAYFWPDTSITDFSSLMSEAADRISTLERELEEARALNNKYAWERDKGDGRNAAWVHDFTIGSLRSALQSEKDREGEDVTALTAKVALLTEALRPFATFAENNTDDDGWAGSSCQRDRICDWFGPSEFRAALTRSQP